MITLHNIHYRSLAIGHLEIPTGITSVIGPNGSGKTTLIRLCAGLVKPESGTILIDGKTPRQCEVGYVNEFPDRNILFSTVNDELASPFRFRHVPCKVTEETITTHAGALGIGHLLGRRMRDLSGGEKVLVALATAFITRPTLLALDEYDSHLDATCSVAIGTMIRQSGAAYIIRCTQQMETAASGNHLLFIDNGRLVHAGTPAAVFASLSGTPFYPLSWRCPF
jgi:energy-coupling factor transport system ATP-binding protein